jgi:hypothetical protein
MREELRAAILNERNQLLHWWTIAFKKNSDWFSNELTQLKNILRLVTEEPTKKRNTDIGNNIRKFHDKLGFMAKDCLKKGGLCAGAIYRSSRFIETVNRSGARGQQTIHIEHTLPIKILRNHLIDSPSWNYSKLLLWLLENSIATAITIEEKDLIEGRLRDHSDALLSGSEGYQKPFMRYESLCSEGAIIWNVFDAVEVDRQSFELKDHRDIVIRILGQIGATAMLSQIGSMRA